MTADDLVERARAARRNAYAPYSGYRVGAALLAEDGRVFTGANVENVSYGLTLCAERAAFVTAVAAGVTRFRALAVVAGEEKAAMCGACRQFAREFGPRLTVHLASADGAYRTTTLGDLLPEAFGPDFLGGAGGTPPSP